MQDFYSFDKTQTFSSMITNETSKIFLSAANTGWFQKFTNNAIGKTRSFKRLVFFCVQSHSAMFILGHLCTYPSQFAAGLISLYKSQKSSDWLSTQHSLLGTRSFSANNISILADMWRTYFAKLNLDPYILHFVGLKIS